jgi:hypothetical protein
MPLVRGTDRGDPSRVRTRRQPVEELAPDHAAAVPILARPIAAGDQQHHPRPLGERLAQAMVEPRMRRVERGAVEVEREVGRDEAARELAVPAGVEAVMTAGA